MKRLALIAVGAVTIAMAGTTTPSSAIALPRCSSNGSVCKADNADACCTAVCRLTNPDDKTGKCAPLNEE